MNYVKENKILLYKYLAIYISNIVLFIFCNFYLKDYVYKELILLFIVLIIDLVIYNYKERVKYKLYIDFILSILLGISLLIIKDENIFGKCLMSIIFANNVVFTRSRLSDKFIRRSLQYLSTLVLMILEVCINLALYLLIW